MLNEFLLSFEALQESSVKLLLSKWNETKEINRNEFLLQQNKKECYLHYIEEGIVRLFTNQNEEGIEANLGFAYSSSLITSFSSFIEETPSKLGIQAITKSKIRSISKNDLFQLVQQHTEISSWYQKVLEGTLSGHINRQIELLTLSPQQRYLLFIKRSGQLVNSIPLKHIASYLRMTPETLSRIRSKIS